MMEFLLFLNAKDKVIVNLVNKANFTFEENTPLCLLGDRYIGFTKRKQRRVVICTQNAMKIGGYLIPRLNNKEDHFDRTGMYIRRALRHEAVHVAQSCNKGKVLNIFSNKDLKLHPYKKNALKNSANISGRRDKELEAYAMEDKPNLVISALKKYSL